MGQYRPLFVYFHSFHIPIQMKNIQFEQYKLKKRLGLEPRAAEWKVQRNPLSYGGTPAMKILSSFYSSARPCQTIFEKFSLNMFSLSSG